MSTEGPFEPLATYVVCGRCAKPISTPQRELIDRARHDGAVWCDDCERAGELEARTRHDHLRPEQLAARPERYAELAGYHAHEWRRFTIVAPAHHHAAALAAGLGFWLHCWQWKEGADTPPTLVEHPAPEGHDTWEEFADSQGELPPHASREHDVQRRATLLALREMGEGLEPDA